MLISNNIKLDCNLLDYCRKSCLLVTFGFWTNVSPNLKNVFLCWELVKIIGVFVKNQWFEEKRKTSKRAFNWLKRKAVLTRTRFRKYNQILRNKIPMNKLKSLRIRSEDLLKLENKRPTSTSGAQVDTCPSGLFLPDGVKGARGIRCCRIEVGE